MIRNLVQRVRGALRDVGVARKRSSKWPAVARVFLELHQTCAACGSATRLQVHHKLPFHLHPSLELDYDNLVVLCMGRNACHLLIGHGDDFKAFTPNLDGMLGNLFARKLTLPAARLLALASRVYR
jgi:hypothetical protein